MKLEAKNLFLADAFRPLSYITNANVVIQKVINIRSFTVKPNKKLCQKVHREKVILQCSHKLIKLRTILSIIMLTNSQYLQHRNSSKKKLQFFTMHTLQEMLTTLI